MRHTIPARPRAAAWLGARLGARPGAPAALLPLAAAALLLGACSGLSDGGLPPGAADPGMVRTQAGARQVYASALGYLQGDLPSYAASSGLLTDELLDGQAAGNQSPSGYTSPPTTIDLRKVVDQQYGAGFDDYRALQALRARAELAITLLSRYDTAGPAALRGHMYAVKGYAEVLLADYFCSGVPLSTMDVDGDWTYKPGSTTQEVYSAAVAAFDSALALSTDSARVLNLARVGKGRALLALGQYAAAAQAVASVPTAYEYAFPVAWSHTPGESPFDGGSPTAPLDGRTVADGEGGNGLPFLSGGDPRTTAHEVGAGSYGTTLYFPDKYGTGDDATPFVLASGVEARLIEAEAALKAGHVAEWAATLNALRSAAGITPLSADSTTGASAASRVDVTFAERAYWLFLTGQRQGDLRRLVRSTAKGGYGRPQQQVYPTGSYPGGVVVYGSDVNAPIPAEERANPSFTGCIDRGA